MSVLFWIKNEKPWRQYVASRVSEIRQLTCKEQWRHCPGVLNPADLPSRGLTGDKLLKSVLWWGGDPHSFNRQRVNGLVKWYPPWTML